jgi:gliding motility-associated-like protein
MLVGSVNAQNPAAPYPAPNYVNGCAQVSPATNDIINHFYTTGGITNIKNLNSGCTSQQTPYNYTLYPPIPTKFLTVAQGQQFKVHVSAGITFSQGFRVWVDWNQDNNYTNANAPGGEMMYQTPATSVTPAGSDSNMQHSPNITVPLNAKCGPTRLRVRGVFASTSFDATSQQTYGETEEYWVVVVGNPAVTPPTTNTTDISICSGSDFTVTANASGTISWFSELYLNTQISASASNIITANSFTFLNLLRDTSIYVQNNQNNCKSARTKVKIQVEPKRVIDITPSDTSICSGDTIVLKGIIQPVAPVFRSFYSTPYTSAQISSNTNRVPDNYLGQHPNSYLYNYVNVDNVAPLILEPGSIEEVGVRISHNRLKDLDIWLISPDGSVIDLSSDNGNTNVVSSANYGSGTGNNLQYCVFRDDAASSITSVTLNNIGGTPYKPEQPLNTLSGSPNGTWTLKIGDDEAGTGTATDIGRLIRWYIKFRRIPNDTTVVWSDSALGISPVTSFSPYAPVINPEDALKIFAHPVANDTKYYFDVYSVPGCMARDSATIHLNSDLQLNVTSNPPEICIGSQAVLTCSVGAGVTIDTTYWSTAYTPVATNVNVVSPSVTTDYIIVAKSTEGCVDTATFQLTVHSLPPSPTVAASGPTTFCLGNSVTLTANPTTGINWSTGATTNSINVATSVSNITCTYTDANGCISPASTSTNVIVNNLPTIPIITPSGATSFCSGESISLSAPAGFTYNWLHDGVSGYAATQNITVNSGNNYAVLITDANGCTAQSVNTNITVFTLPPAPVITPQNPTSFCPGGYVTLQSSPAVQYNWTPSALDQQNNTVATAGNYSLTVTDANGCTSASSNVITVTIFPTPATPLITASGPLDFCIGNDVTLSAPSSNSYLWTPTGATTQSITVSTNGNYAVQVTNTNGCTSIFSSSANVIVNPLPQAPILTPLTPTTICDGNFASINAGSFASYLWSDGSTTNPGMFNTSGVYTVIVTDNNGCTSPSSLPINITVNPLPPTPSLIANGPTTFCVFDSVGLVANSIIPNPIYHWRPVIVTSSQNTLYVNQSGSYDVSVIDNNGCKSPPSPSINVVVRPIPNPPQIISSGPTTFCEGDSVTLSISSGSNFVWSTGSTDPTIVVFQLGGYFASVTDYCNITHNPTININVKEKPIADFAISDTVGCTPFEVKFTNKSINADNYVWNFTTNELYTDTNPTFIFEEPRTYSVILTANSVNGCTNTKTYYNLIKASTKPVIDFDFSPNPALTSTPFVRFYSVTQGATHLTWSCPDYQFTDSTYKTMLFMPDTGIHEMTLIAANDDGCVDSLTKPVKVEGDFLLYVPNTFTPSNNDGLNDIFIPVTDYMDYTSFTMRIFDRWGKEVFFTNDAKKGWDGLIDGERVIGVYNWMIDCLDTRGVTHSKSGSVNILN